MNKNILVIVPVHEYNEQVGEMLLKAIHSVPSEYDVVISTTKDISEQINNIDRNVKFVFGETTNTDFCTLVNNAVDSEYEWFSILEFDDTFNSIWFNNVEKYIDYKSDVSVFLPLTELVDYSNGEFLGYGNEAPWASSFSEEIGYIDNECIQQYFDFYMTGGVFNTKDFNEVGGLKPSIKLTFWYEFLLRMTNNSKKVYVIPKLGYNHYLNRETSLYDIYQKSIGENEGAFWLEVAKQDYFYKSERSKDKYTFEQ